MGNTLTVAGKAATLESGQEFDEWVDQRLLAQRSILDTVKDAVRADQIEPVAGARIMSCVAGSIFGYEEFHPRQGQPAAEQLLEMLDPQRR